MFTNIHPAHKAELPQPISGPNKCLACRLSGTKPTACAWRWRAALRFFHVAWQTIRGQIAHEENHPGLPGGIRSGAVRQRGIEQEQCSGWAGDTDCLCANLRVRAESLQIIAAIRFGLRQTWMFLHPCAQTGPEEPWHTVEASVLFLVVQQIQNALHRAAHAHMSR